MSTLVVITLVLVLFGADGSIRTSHHEVVGPEIEAVAECKLMGEAALTWSKASHEAIDLGYICVKSEFDAAVKPKA